MKRSMKRANIFQGIKGNRPGTNAFDLSHEKKLSMKMADLVPTYVQEIVPGDKFRVSSETFLRMAPLISPVMHRVNVYTHFFFVPNRLVWDGWEEFITGGEDGLNASTVPKMALDAANASRYAKGSLSDYFGIPIPDPSPTQTMLINALPFRSYQAIYNEYYRDENLQEKIEFDKGNVANNDQAELTQLRKRNWEKDYFTSSLPWLQKGPAAQAPITLSYASQARIAGGDGTSYPTQVGNLVHDNQGNIASDQGATWNEIENIDPEATGIDVNELRKAVRLQEWLERNARAGSRYVESIFAHFGIISDDLRHNRPQYLGGGKQPVTISEVLQTGATGTDDTIISTPQGNMAGHAVSYGSGRFKGRFKEHGHVIGITSVLPRTAYQQGIERIWTKETKFDYYWPEFAQLGEQEVLNRELYVDWQNANNENTFGYQSRYAEYKYRQSSVHGDFRDTLQFWHMGRKFDSAPALNSDFIQSDPTERIFAVEDDGVSDKLYVQIFNSVKAIRPMPYYNDPTL